MSVDDILDEAPTDLWIRPEPPVLAPPPLPVDGVRDAVREETRELRELLRELVTDPRLRDRAAGGTGEPRYLNPSEAARMAGVQVQTIQRWVRAGRLRGHSAGRVLRIRLDDLQAFLARGPSSGERVSDADLDARAAAILGRNKRTRQDAK
jgi:excisionase family DNA binding protein